MSMPGGIGIIDLMLNVPGEHSSKWYDFMRPLLLDTESREQFRMPAQYLIPDTSELAGALERTLLYTPLKYGRNVQNPVLEALGFDRKRALERAAQEAKLLPTGLGADYVGLSRTGEFVLSPQPDPTPAAD